MKILAIDQASSTSGWAIFDNKELIEYGKVVFDDDDFIYRISKLRLWLDEFINENNKAYKRFYKWKYSKTTVLADDTIYAV